MMQHETLNRFTIDCPHCATELEVDDSFVGEQVECTICNAEFVVAGEAGAIAVREPAPATPQPDVEPQEPAPSRSKWRQSRWAKYEQSAKAPEKRGRGTFLKTLTKAVVVLALVAAVAFAAIYFIGSRPKSDVPKYLPATTLLYVRASNLEDLQAALKQSDTAPSKSEVLNTALFNALNCSNMVHFAILEGKREPEGLLVFECGDDDAMEDALAKLADKSKEDETVEQTVTYKVRDDDWKYWAADEDMVVLSTNKEALTDFLVNKVASTDDCLATVDSYSAARSENGRYDVFAYMPIDAIPRMNGAKVTKGEEAFITGLMGTLEGQAVSAGMSIDGTELRVTFENPDGVGVLSGMMDGVKPVDSDILNYVPNSSMAYVAMGELGSKEAWDKALAEVGDLYKKNAGKHVHASFTRAIDQAKMTLGLGISEIPSLVRGACICIGSGGETFADCIEQRIVFIVRVSDTAQANTAVKNLFKSLLPDAKKSEQELAGLKVTTLSVKNPYNGERYDVASYAFNEDCLILSPNALGIKACMEAKSGENLTDTRMHGDTVSRTHNKGWLRAYFDMSTFIEMADARAQKRLKKVFSAEQAIAASIAVKGGRASLTISQNKPVDLSEFVTIASEAGGKARMANCKGNLKQFSLVLLSYSGNNGGRFPNDLSAVVGSLPLSKVYVCPCSSDSVPSSAAAVRAGKTSYRYFGNGLRDDIRNANRTVILCDKPGNHPNWINVLFADGHVEGCEANSIEEAARKRNWILPKTR